MCTVLLPNEALDWFIAFYPINISDEDGSHNEALPICTNHFRLHTWVASGSFCYEVPGMVTERTSQCVLYKSLVGSTLFT